MCLNVFRVVLKMYMRKRTLSDQGIKLFLNGIEVKRKKRNLRQMVWNLFHSDYDDSLERVVAESLESSRSLVNDFGSETFENSLQSSVSHTIKLILTHDKKMTRRQLTKNVRFFVDVMKLSFNKGDYQTAHLILFALSHPIMTNLSYKLQKWAPAKIKEIRLFFGCSSAIVFSQNGGERPEKKNKEKPPITLYKIISAKRDTTFLDTSLTIERYYKFNYLRKDNFELQQFSNVGQPYNDLSYDFDIHGFVIMSFFKTCFRPNNNFVFVKFNFSYNGTTINHPIDFNDL